MGYDPTFDTLRNHPTASVGLRRLIRGLGLLYTQEVHLQDSPRPRQYYVLRALSNKCTYSICPTHKHTLGSVPRDRTHENMNAVSALRMVQTRVSLV